MNVEVAVLGMHPVPKGLYGPCGREATLDLNVAQFRAQELCESQR